MELLKSEDSDYKVIIVGDAEMAPSELTWANGAVDYWYHNDTPGIIWMQRFKEKFKKDLTNDFECITFVKSNNN